MSSHSSKITILPESQRTPSMETCCMLPVHLTQSWANWWGQSCPSSTSAPWTPPLLQPWARSHSPCAAAEQQPLLQSRRQQESGTCTQTSCMVPHDSLCRKGAERARGCRVQTQETAQTQPLQTTPCTGLFRRAHSSQHSFPPANLGISMPVCINIFLQRERGKLPGGSWAGDP